MIETTISRKTVREGERTMDAIAFQTSITLLNAAIEAAADQGTQTRCSAQTAREVLALVEESIMHSTALTGVQGAAVIEPLQRLRCAALPVGIRQPLCDPR